MESVSVSSLRVNEFYNEIKLTLEIIHVCPFNREENELKSNRFILCRDLIRVDDHNQDQDKYLIVKLFGSIAKTPFKKTSLQVGQCLSVSRFKTELTPNTIKFKVNNKTITNFYNFFLSLLTDYDPIIKLTKNSVVSKELRRKDCEEDDDSVDDSQEESSKSVRSKRKKDKIAMKEVNIPSPKLANSRKHNSMKNKANKSRQSSSPANKRLKFSSDSESEESLNLPSKRASPTKSKRSPAKPSSTSTSHEEETAGKPKYEFKSLYEVHKLIPVSHKTYVHVFGVLFKKCNHEIYLCDESCNSFTVKLTFGSNNNNDYPQMLSGDIIRIHRVLLATNNLHKLCLGPKDLVVFRAFQESNSFEPIFSAENPTIEESDKTRKKELEGWFAEKLIDEPFSELESDCVVNLVGQVIRIETYYDRTFIQLWDATKPDIRTFNSRFNNNIECQEGYESVMKLINDNHMSVFVTLYDEHSVDASLIQPWDYVVLFNVKIRDSPRFPDFKEVSLHSTYQWGRCIRIVDPHSFLGKKLANRIQDFISVSTIENTSSFMNEFLDSGNDFTPDVDEILMQDDNDDQVGDEEVDILAQEVALPIKPRSVTLKQLISSTELDQTYLINGKVVCYFPFQDMENCIYLFCPRTECSRMIPFKKALTEHADLVLILQNRYFDKLNNLKCTVCSERNEQVSSSTYLQLVFKILFVIEDANKDKIVAELSHEDACQVMGITPQVALSEADKLQGLKESLHWMCSNRLSLSADSNSNRNLKWTIKTINASTKHFIYQIKDVREVEKSDKSVGCKL